MQLWIFNKQVNSGCEVTLTPKSCQWNDLFSLTLTNLKHILHIFSFLLDHNKLETKIFCRNMKAFYRWHCCSIVEIGIKLLSQKCHHSCKLDDVRVLFQWILNSFIPVWHSFIQVWHGAQFSSIVHFWWRLVCFHQRVPMNNPGRRRVGRAFL